MDLNPFDGLAKFFLGLISQGKLQGWIKLAVAIAMTTFVNGVGIFGITLLAGQGWTNAVGAACVAVSVSTVVLWMRSPELTKGVPIAWLGRINVEVNKALIEETVVTIGERRK